MSSRARNTFPEADPLAGLLAELAAVLGAEPAAERLTRFKYRGLFGRPVVTDLLIFTGGARPVVVATERQDNPGASITNTCGELAATLAAHADIVGADFILVEHYPPYRYGAADLKRALDRVEFGFQSGKTWQSPKWLHLEVGDLARLIAPPAVPSPS